MFVPSEPTCYDTLEIRKEATYSEIEKAFEREKIKLNALSAKSPALEQRQLEVEEAYRILCDSKSRATYDQQLSDSKAISSRPNSVEESEGFIGARTAEETIAQNPRYKLTLRKARRTEEGIEIELTPSSWNHTAATEELRRHVPSGFLKFDSSRNSWTVAKPYEAALRELFLNLDFALGEGESSAPEVFNIPPFQVTQPVKPQVYSPEIAKNSERSAARQSRWTANINGTTLGIAGVVLLIGWNLYVAGSQRQQQEEVFRTAIAPTPTQTPGPTNTPEPTPTPIPVTLAISPKYPRVHLRAGPSQDTASLGFILAEEEVKAIGRTSNVEWIQIETAVLTGWSASWTLNGQERLEELPIVVP